MVVTLEGYYAEKMHVLVRFGRWRDILAIAEAEAERKLGALST